MTPSLKMFKEPELYEIFLLFLIFLLADPEVGKYKRTPAA